MSLVKKSISFLLLLFSTVCCYSQEVIDDTYHLPSYSNNSTNNDAFTINDEIRKLRDGSGILKRVYPVGSIYISTSSQNPATTFGFGTWSAFGTGRTIVGVDVGQAEFDTVEETGGEKTHTLTIAEMPSHNHGLPPVNSMSSGSSAAIGTDAPALDTLTSNSGGGNAHNNLQPYITVYMWERVA